MLDKIKSLSKQTLIYGTSTIIGRFLNFLLVPFYTNIFPPSEYGIVAVVYAFIAFMNIVYSAGLEQGFFKFASSKEIGTPKQNFSIPFFSILVISAFFSITIYIFALNVPGLWILKGTSTLIINYTAFILFFDALVLVPFARLRLDNKPKIFAAIKIANIVSNVVLNVILIIYFKMGIEAIFLSNLISSVITFILLLPVIVKNLSFKFNRQLFNELLKFSLPYIPAGLSSIIVQVISRPVMLLLTNEENVGIFQANYRLGIFMMLVVSMFDYAWRPFFLNIAKEKDAKQVFAGILTYFTGFCTVVLIILTFFIEDIIKIPLPGRGTLIGAKYWAGIYIVPIVLFAYIFNGIYINLMPGIYFEKKTKFLPFITGLGAIVNVAGNFILIPLMGLYGAAIATLLSYVSMAIYIYIVTQKFYPVKYDFKKTYLLILINISAMAVFYISYYKVLNINLIVKAVLVIIFSAVTIQVAGLWKAGQLLKKSKTGKETTDSVTPESMPQVTDENPEL